ncbi:MAG TPA: sulfurtransferase TusA family protein [Sphingopyxis sp.]|nr:sulfurtransferase TusA family protein [Sphingopyxis sp.]
MTSDAAALLVDARGMRCPWPVLRLARAMRSQDQALLLADDPQAEREVRALAAEQGWSVEVEGGGWRICRR